MHLVVQAVILGVLTGGVYALIATGQTLIFGVMRVINLAQGAMVILSAYLSYDLFTRLGLDPFLSVLVTTPIMFALGVAVQYVFLRRLRADEGELSLLVMFAIAVAIEGVLGVRYQTTFRAINPAYRDDTWTVFGYQFSVVRVAAFALCIGVLLVLYGVLRRTRLGYAIRATVQNPTAARLLGVEASRVQALGFGIGAATAAVGGAVYGAVYSFNAGSHYDLVARLLAIVVLGGLGSVGGAVVAAMVMGVTEAVLAAEWSPVWSSFSFFVVLLAVLLLRPRGLFGVATRGAL